MKLDATTIGQVYDRCHAPRPQGLSLFAVRGALVRSGQVQINPDRYNEWNDTICLVDLDQGVVYGHWDATAGQPGTYWTKHPTYAGPDTGAPFTMPCFGVQLVVGDGTHAPLHRGKWWCLRQQAGQAGAYPVVRDVDQDEQLEPSDKYTWATADNGINVHWEERKSKRVEFASSGCHVMNYAYDSSERQAFRTRVVEYQQAGQQVFRYAVVESGWLLDGRERVLYGSAGDDVKWFQDLLNREGYPVKVDGQFGKLTHERAVQRNLARLKAGIDVTREVDQWGVGIVPEAAPPKYELHLDLGDHEATLPFVMPDGQTAMVGVRDMVEALDGVLITEHWPQLFAKIEA